MSPKDPRLKRLCSAYRKQWSWKNLAPYRAFGRSEYLRLMTDVFPGRLIQSNPSVVVTNGRLYITPTVHLHLLADEGVAGAVRAVSVNKEVTLGPK